MDNLQVCTIVTYHRQWFTLSPYISTCAWLWKAVRNKSGRKTPNFRYRENLDCHFRTEIAKLGVHLTLNRSANWVFLTKKGFFKNKFYVVDVLYPGHSVTGHLENGRFVSWKLQYVRNWAFGKWMICNWTLYVTGRFGVDPSSLHIWAGIFKNSMGARHRLGIGLSYRPATPGYIGWRSWCLGIDSWAP